MKVLVTGAGGFLGGNLVRALLADPGSGVSHVVAADLTPCPVGDPRVDVRTGSVADPGFVRSVVEPDVAAVYHLAAVLSGQSEAEFDTGMRVNVDATRLLLEACRALGTKPRVVFSSTVAVFGGALPPVVPEDFVLLPQTTYGIGKAIAELLVGEYSRRGFIDGLSCRLATITVRPGKANSALSSFASGIIREPLNGEDTTCPVPLETPMWVSSPDMVIRNLVHAGRVPTATLGFRRSLNLPGISVTAGEMLASLERLGGPAARARVRVERDERVARAVLGWPAALDDTRACSLGFTRDENVDAIVRQYIATGGFDRAPRASGTRT